MTDSDASEQDNPREGIDLRPDGGIHLWLDGKRHRLRRPRGREFRKLREELQDHLDAISAASDAEMEWSTALLARGEEREAAGKPRVTAEERAEDRRRGRALRDITEGAVTAWWASVIATLSVNDAEVDAEDLPAWLVNVGQATDVLEHWRSVPSLSGAP